MSVVRIRRAAGAIVLAAAGAVFFHVFASSRDETTPLATAEARAVYWTWDRLEPDTVASAWLLQRFASPGCEVRFVTRGEVLDEGTAFDIPLADLARTRVQSTFHVLRERFAIVDPAVTEIERLIDEIEINNWDRFDTAAGQEFERELREAIASSESPDAALDASYKILDRRHTELHNSQP